MNYRNVRLGRMGGIFVGADEGGSQEVKKAGGFL
jgi:hypothetical protein